MEDYRFDDRQEGTAEFTNIFKDDKGETLFICGSQSCCGAHMTQQEFQGLVNYAREHGWEIK